MQRARDKIHVLHHVFHLNQFITNKPLYKTYNYTLWLKNNKSNSHKLSSGRNPFRTPKRGWPPTCACVNYISFFFQTGGYCLVPISTFFGLQIGPPISEDGEGIWLDTGGFWPLGAKPPISTQITPPHPWNRLKQALKSPNLPVFDPPRGQNQSK